MPGSNVLTVATWNLCRDGSGRAKQIKATRPDLLCAQEVVESAHNEILNSKWFDWGIWSHDLRPRLSGQSGKDRLGVAVYGRQNTRVQGAGLNPDSPRQDKFVWVTVNVDGWNAPLTVCSFHALPGPDKTFAMLAAATWLAQFKGLGVIGLDANSPYIDAPDHGESVYFGDDASQSREAALIGAKGRRVHGFEDAYRRFRERRGIASAGRVDYALEPTYNRSKSENGRALARYDSIWMSPQVALAPEGSTPSVQHLNGMGEPGSEKPAFKPRGGSDHAMVVARITPRIVSARAKGVDVVKHLQSIPEALPDGTPVRFNLNAVPDKVRPQVEGLVAGLELGAITWRSAGRELEVETPLRLGDGIEVAAGNYTMAKLAQELFKACTDTSLPGRPPGPHWWTVDGLTLAELSALGD